MVDGMTEERYTLAEAEILLNRQACERAGHQIERIKASGWVANEKDHYRCGRCDVWIEFTYPPSPMGAAVAQLSLILVDLDMEPSFDNVGFQPTQGQPVCTFTRGGLLPGGEIRSPRGRWWVHEWMRNGRSDQIFSWPEVVAAAKGAPIHAWNDGEWVQGEAKP